MNRGREGALGNITCGQVTDKGSNEGRGRGGRGSHRGHLAKERRTRKNDLGLLNNGTGL